MTFPLTARTIGITREPNQIQLSIRENTTTHKQRMCTSSLHLVRTMTQGLIWRLQDCSKTIKTDDLVIK